MNKRPTARLMVAALSIGLATEANAAKPIEFAARCNSGPSITIAAVGDLLFHTPLQARALEKGGNYHHFWKAVEPVFTAADITYGNLEGPVAEGVLAGGYETKDPGRRLDYKVYGSPGTTINFNYHPSLVGDLTAAGFDIVSTANNHALDRGAIGIDRTINNLEAEGLAFTGTRKRGETKRSWSTVIAKKGFSVAWLACTWGTNGFRDAHGQVLNCYEQKDEVLAEIKKRSEDPKIDAVIVTPHWGEEGRQRPMQRERLLAQEFIEAGATAIIGTHPHVLQPWQKITTSTGREGLVVYSTGNFVSNQREPEQRSGEIVVLQIGKADDAQPGQKAELRAAGFVPTWVNINAGYSVIENTGQTKLLTTALNDTLELLPTDNRINVAGVRQMIRDCPAVATPVAEAPTYRIEPVATAQPLPPATTNVTGADEAKTADSAAPIAAAKTKVAEARPAKGDQKTVVSRLFGWWLGSVGPAAASSVAMPAPNPQQPATPATAKAPEGTKPIDTPVVVASAASKLTTLNGQAIGTRELSPPIKKEPAFSPPLPRLTELPPATEAMPAGPRAEPVEQSEKAEKAEKARAHKARRERVEERAAKREPAPTKRDRNRYLASNHERKKDGDGERRRQHVATSSHQENTAARVRRASAQSTSWDKWAPFNLFKPNG